MAETTADPRLADARDAAGRGNWAQAYALLKELDAADRLGRSELPLLAEAAYAAGHLDETIETWERTHAECVAAGERVEAAGAAARVAMHLLFDTALMAPVRGWLARAERLLGDQEETPVHAWLAVVHSYERLLAGDLTGARSWSVRAIDVGSRRQPAAAAIGRVARARTLILEGETREGLALLEEAGVATSSGELDPLSTGIVYCELVCALQGLAHYDLAEEWTEAMERWRPTAAVGSIHGRCRVHRAEILRLRGDCDQAEREALTACEELRPYMHRELGWPLCELGRIRLHMRDIDGAAEAFAAAHQAGWEPQPGLALVQLARGEIGQASASIRDALEHPIPVPSKELPPSTELRRVPLLEAQVEIAIAAGELDRARTAADELDRIAARFESKALAAGAALARARVGFADEDAAAARRQFELAARLWREVGAPYETALAHAGLAGVHRAEGNEQRAAMEQRTADAMFERIGAAQPPASAGSSAAVEAATDARAPGETFRREGDYWLVAFADRTVRIRDLKGMRYLARLLAEPGREFHVVDLVGLESEGAGPTLGDAGEMLDGPAREAYRRRLAEIDEDLADAQATGDETRVAQAEAERDFLARELSRAVGLGGRDRRAGSPSERARASVTRAIRQAMARVREHHPALADHLERTIRTGSYCAYAPDPRAPVTWNV